MFLEVVKDWAKSRKEVITGIILLMLWLTDSRGMFKAENKAIKALPLLLSSSSSYDEKKLFFDGPVYLFALEAQHRTPEDSKIYLFNPYTSGASYIYLKTRYYLYPRKLHDAGGEINIDELLKYNYLIFVVPIEKGSEAVEPVYRIPFLKRVYQNLDENGLIGIYRVDKGVEGR